MACKRACSKGVAPYEKLQRFDQSCFSVLAGCAGVNPWFLQFDGGEEDFWFRMRIDGFAAGDKGSQCGYGYND